jgi:membrane-bound lytic murein transglycosylase D
MKSKALVVVILAVAVCAGGCFFAGAGRDASQRALERATGGDDYVYRLCPQLLTLEGKLDRASTYFYFGEHELASATAGDLITSIADLKSTLPDSAVCDHLDYLEDRAQCLLERMNADALERETTCHVTTFLDSIARNTVVEQEIEIEFNPKTDYWIRYFQGSGRRHFARWLERTAEYRAVIEPILVEVGVPRDLLFLAVIESGLNLDARSRMRAIGPWQFMSGTARLFGLRINWWIDERKDIVASTYAAANYLNYLYNLFGSWQLALAAYNAGEHRVAYAMTRQRTNDYWRLRLPAQTAWFVPKFMAALAIGRNPEAYGFEKPGADPFRFDLIEVERPISLRALAEASDCSVSDITRLNPHLKKWCTPPDMVVEVKVPDGKGDQCLARLADVESQRMVSFVQHKVKKGETLSGIAASYELSVKELKRFNDMGSSQMIRTGNILLIPVKDLRRPVRVAGRPSYRNPILPRDNIAIPSLEDRREERTISYIVKDDETLVKIAERFHTGLGDLRSWNNLSLESVIRPGDTLMVRLAPDMRSDPAENLDGPAAREDDGSTRAPREEGQERSIIHIVKKGETLSSIGRRYRVRLADILAWNNRSSRRTLYPGEKILIWVKGD